MRETEHTNTVKIDSTFSFRTATMQDGVAVWKAVQAAGTLELNTAYFYLIFCSDFGQTCLIAQQNHQIAGVLVGYRPPKHPDTAFCWQIGVLPAWRGQGLARRMLEAWLALPANQDARWLTATVAASNEASKRLFRGYADSNGLTCTVTPHFTEDLLPAGHEPEPLYRIGPIEARLP